MSMIIDPTQWQRIEGDRAPVAGTYWFVGTTVTVATYRGENELLFRGDREGIEVYGPISFKKQGKFPKKPELVLLRRTKPGGADGTDVDVGDICWGYYFSHESWCVVNLSSNTPFWREDCFEKVTEDQVTT